MWTERKHEYRTFEDITNPNYRTVILAFARLSKQYGWPPSFREMKEETGLSLPWLHQMFRTLRRLDILACEPRRARTLHLTPKGKVIYLRLLRGDAHA